MKSRRSGRLNPSKNHLKQGSNGRFKKVCGSIIHLALDDEHVFSDNQIETLELALRSYNLGNEISKSD